jgi:hypothetical protein
MRGSASKVCEWLTWEKDFDAAAPSITAPAQLTEEQTA